jgi:hypothetical protein
MGVHPSENVPLWGGVMLVVAAPAPMTDEKIRRETARATSDVANKQGGFSGGLISHLEHRWGQGCTCTGQPSVEDELRYWLTTRCLDLEIPVELCDARLRRWASTHSAGFVIRGAPGDPERAEEHREKDPSLAEHWEMMTGARPRTQQALSTLAHSLGWTTINGARLDNDRSHAVSGAVRDSTNAPGHPPDGAVIQCRLGSCGFGDHRADAL